MIEIISIHIPKTAGTSFFQVLRHEYGPKRVVKFNRKDVAVSTLGGNRLGAVLPPEITVIHGHFLWAEVNDIAATDGCKLIAWFREPVERLVSNFGYFKMKIHSEPTVHKQRHRIDESLMQYCGNKGTRNKMSEFMQDAPLDSFFFLGLQECFTSDLAMLGRMLDWKREIPAIHALDNSAFKKKHVNVADDDRSHIMKMNANDVALYQRVLRIRQQRFPELSTPEHLDPIYLS